MPAEGLNEYTDYVTSDIKGDDKKILKRGALIAVGVVNCLYISFNLSAVCWPRSPRTDFHSLDSVFPPRLGYNHRAADSLSSQVCGIGTVPFLNGGTRF